MATPGTNRLTLDGIPDDVLERFSGASYSYFTPLPDAVQETKIENGIFDAQIGHGNGVVSNVVVKSGTNSLHGAAYYAFQNTYLDANYYQNVSAHIARPNNQVNQTGIVLDGPIVLPKIYNGRDKAFFMFSAERYATHTPQTFSTRVPTSAELTGDFSGLRPGGFNSSGFCASTGGVQLFVWNSPVDGNGNRTEFFLNNNIVASTFGTAAYTCTGTGPTCVVTKFGVPPEDPRPSTHRRGPGGLHPSPERPGLNGGQFGLPTQLCLRTHLLPEYLSFLHRPFRL